MERKHEQTRVRGARSEGRNALEGNKPRLTGSVGEISRAASVTKQQLSHVDPWIVRAKERHGGEWTQVKRARTHKLDDNLDGYRRSSVLLGVPRAGIRVRRRRRRRGRRGEQEEYRRLVSTQAIPANKVNECGIKKESSCDTRGEYPGMDNERERRRFSRIVFA
jgi:hypothetical protein